MRVYTWSVKKCEVNERERVGREGVEKGERRGRRSVVVVCASESVKTNGARREENDGRGGRGDAGR